MDYVKFTVERLTTTPSGTYAVYTKDDGSECWTGNFGFKEGDVVEMWGYDGYAPKRIDVNGITTWTEQERLKWWENYDNKGRSLMNPYNSQK